MPMRAENTVTAHSPARITGADKLVKGTMLTFARSDFRAMVHAMERATKKYTMKVVSMAHRVPLGMALLGLLRSPDMDAPAKMPDVALECVRTS